MTSKKVYAVVIYDQAAEELKDVIALWHKKGHIGSYLYAKKIEPNGAYFLMTLEHKTPNDDTIEFELQLPHHYIKAIFYSADIKKLGFT